MALLETEEGRVNSMSREPIRSEPQERPLRKKQTTSDTALPPMTSAEVTTLLRFSPDALIVVNPAGIIVQVNEQAAALFDYEPSQLPGQSLEILLPKHFHQAHLAHRLRYMSAPQPRPMGAGLNLVGLRRDGREFPIDISLRPVWLNQTPHVLGAIRDVSTQRRLEQERLQQMEQLALQGNLINQAHDAILVRDPISRILVWNRGAEILYGWSEQEALGRISHTLLQTRFPISLVAIDAHLESEGQWEGELVHTCRDGHVVIVESRQITQRDAQGSLQAILEINRDITRRKRLEEVQTSAYTEALAQRTFLQQMLDILPSGICVVHGVDARLVLANREAASIWGTVWRPEQPMQAFLEEHGIRIIDTTGKPLAPEAWATMQALDGMTVLQQQEMIRQPSGKRLPIMVNAVPLSSPHWQSLGLPELSRASQPLVEKEPLALVIYQNVRLLKEAEYLKDEFIGIAAHELRQPLTILKGMAETLLIQTARGHGPALADWQQESIQDIESATDQLAQLTDDLLDASRLQAGQLVLHRASTNLVILAQRVVQRFQVETTLHQLALQATDARIDVFIDPQRIEQVLSNLLTNAIKYSPQGGPINVTLLLNDSQETEIRVQDHGLGIPRQHHSRIFGRFARADNVLAAGIRGTGLGLYLCRALVEQHQGRIWFESEEGEGTTFFIRLPLVASPANQ
jgi:PAS domain S-box-containing protein